MFPIKEQAKQLTRSLLALALCLSLSPLAAQERTGEIRGTVIDDDGGVPLIGANVLLEGTKLGSAANRDGVYSIKRVPPGTYTVIARFIGYKQASQTVSVADGATAVVDFVLKSTVLEMDEVVITGQGSAVEKRKLSTSVETISARELELVPVRSVDQLLQGRVPGLSSFAPSGFPGTGARIQTRGIKSVALNSTPVIYVDGVRVDNNDNFRLSFDTGGQVSSSLADLVTGEIDRVEVIKGGASSTLYGSEAANGVIQIFTKKGVPGDARWRFNVTTGSDVPENKFTYEQFTKDSFFRNSTFQGYGLNVTGGSENFSYNISGKASDNRGIVVQDKLFDKQYNLAAGMRTLLSQNADAEFSASFTRSQFGRLFNDNNGSAPLTALELEGDFRRLARLGGDPDSLLNMFLLSDLKEVANRFISAINVNYSPAPRWSNKFTVGVDYRKSEDRQFAPIESESVVGTEGGFLTASHREFLTVTLGYTGSYTLPKLGPFNQTVSVGAQGFRVEDRENFGAGTTFRIPGTTDFDNASAIDAQESNRQLFSGGVFIVDQVGVNDRLFLDLGVRFDGNSAFGEDVGIQTYPKAGVAYNVSEESFYPKSIKPYVSSLKLRTAYGKTGNFPDPFVRDRTYISNVFLDEAAITFGNPGDQSLKAEKTTSIDYGFDAGLLNDRVSLEFTVFKQNTKDALFFVATDPASGFGNQQRNVGEIENKGIEISLRANVLKIRNFELNARGSLATLENKVTDLGSSPAFTIAGFNFAPQRVEAGRPVGVYRINRPRLEADGTYQGNFDVVFEGTPTPKRTGSFGLDLTIRKKLTVTGIAEFASGHVVLNQGLSRRIVNSQAGDVLYPEDFAKIPVSANPARPYTRNTASSVLLEKGNWFKIREVSLRYQLPNLGLQSLAVIASVRNLAILGTKTWFADPELSFIRAGGNLEVGGVIGANPSPPKQFRLGFDVTL